MNVTLQNIDQVSARLTVNIQKDDYQEAANKSLKKLRQSAQMPGFRRGMVPMGLIKKMYEKSVRAEEVNKLLSEATYNYIKENKVKMLGEPLPDEELQKPIDFDTQEDFEFVLDIALAPQLGISLSADDHLSYYNIEVTPEAIDATIAREAQSRGSFQEVDTFMPNALLEGQLTELDEDGQPKAEGINVPDAKMMPTYMKDETEKAKFDGAHKGDTIILNPNAAWQGNQAELASLLQVDKEVATTITSNFSYQINSMQAYVPAPVDQKLFDQVCGEGKVNSEDDFRAYVAGQIQTAQQPASEARLQEDLRGLLMQKAGRPQLADNLLKRILIEKGKDNTPEKVDAEYERSIEALTWHLVKEELVEAYAIKVDDADVLEEAKAVVRAHYAQYSQYGPMPEDFVEKTATELLAKEDNVDGLVDRAIERKITAQAKQVITLDEQTISPEDFARLGQPAQEENVAPEENVAEETASPEA